MLLRRRRAAGDPFVAPMMYRDDGRLNVGFVVFFMSYVIIVVTPSQTPRLAPPRPAALSLSIGGLTNEALETEFPYHLLGPINRRLLSLKLNRLHK